VQEQDLRQVLIYLQILRKINIREGKNTQSGR